GAGARHPLFGRRPRRGAGQRRRARSRNAGPRTNRRGRAGPPVRGTRGRAGPPMRGWRSRVAAIASALALAAGPLAAQGGGAARVDHARMLAADADAGQWMSVGRTYDEQRFSPLAQINDGNVGRLGLAWYADIATTRGM